LFQVPSAGVFFVTCCFFFKDCSNSFYYFEKYQDLPTRGARTVEQFSINGSLFLAFANNRGDTEGFKTESFIYKLNISSRKFLLYQTIDTTGAWNIKYFTIADKNYLAVASNRNGTRHKLNSVIYQWNGHQFVAFQIIPTRGLPGFNYFKILQDPFLAVTNGAANSVNYKWKNNHFEKFQEIGTERAVASTAIVLNKETFIAFATMATPDSTPLYSSGQETVLSNCRLFKRMEHMM